MAPIEDERGFILSGLALLLILPAMLLSASYLSVVGMGGETTSLQSISDRVHNAGLDVKNTIEWMWENEGASVDNVALWMFERSYENATGLMIDISHVGDNRAKISIAVQDRLGRAHFEETLDLMEVGRDDG